MEGGQAPGSSLSSLISGFNARIADLQELVIARSMKGMELQVQSIKSRLQEEILAIPKAKSIIDASLKQQKNLQEMTLQVRRHFPEKMALSHSETPNCLTSETLKADLDTQSHKLEESEPPALIKEKKVRGSPPVWYISSEELDSLSSYMRGRLTLEKVNAAVNDMASYAEATAQLVSAPRKKLPESMLEKALERRDIAMTEGIKGKHFFLESDMKGPTLKLDNTGKSILTVLRHLGRISEMRVGHHRVIILSKPQLSVQRSRFFMDTTLVASCVDSTISSASGISALQATQGGSREKMIFSRRFTKFNRTDYVRYKQENRIMSDGVNAKLLGCMDDLQTVNLEELS